MQKLLDTLSHIPSEASECVVKDMKATPGLVVWLFTLSQGMDTPCDGRREGALCYGPLGGEIVFSLVDKDTYAFNWRKEYFSLVTVRKNQIRYTFPKRFSFTPNNGRLKIETLMRNDSGKYTLSIFSNEGMELQSRTLQLFIEDPVISVHLVSKCQFQGKQPVTCLPKGGDNLQYSWSLNKKPLQDSDLLSGYVQANNITLKPSISGQLVCSVKNNVSEIRKEVFVSCGMDTPCDGRREGALCYGPLGGEIVFSLVDKDTSSFIWDKGRAPLVIVRNNQIRYIFSKRFSFTPNNGRLKIENLTRNDSGNYTLSSFSNEGVERQSRTLQLFIEDGSKSNQRNNYLLIMRGVLSALFILLLIGLVVVYKQKKKQSSIEAEEELTYANVRLNHQPRR
ncbi:uncharacterized protein LOC133162998 [Syngnathus typhle]|uniref:uncharacterized protein LOC133162998 n=1 Tax=Syngnathus typhle TaxID=161592 RepID=UPI002A6A097D|nr:uncharacterized protein LOC133162998 [Syngnathus typhle]